MRVGHDQKVLFSNCKELPIHSTKYNIRMLSLSSNMNIISASIWVTLWTEALQIFYFFGGVLDQNNLKNNQSNPENDYVCQNNV